MFNIEETNNEKVTKTEEIVDKLEEMNEDELEQLKIRLQQIKKKKEQERIEKKEFTEEEIAWRFEYFAMQKQEELKKSIPGFLLSFIVFLTFLIIQLVSKEASLWYGVGFSFLFVLGLTVYTAVTIKEIKALKIGAEKPMENMHLVVHEKKWYEMEYDKLSDEEKEERRKLYNSTFNKMFARYKKK